MTYYVPWLCDAAEVGVPFGAATAIMVLSGITCAIVAAGITARYYQCKMDNLREEHYYGARYLGERRQERK